MRYMLLLLSPLLLWGEVHYAKLEPYERITLKASVSGEVMIANMALEGSIVEDKKILQLDDALNRVDLKQTQTRLALLNETLQLNHTIATLLEKNLKRQKRHYQRMSQLSTASIVQKDNAYSSYISVKNRYLSTKEKIISLKQQKSSLNYKVAQLKDTIAKKSLILHGLYLYQLMVHKGDFVVPGTPLATVYDTHKAKLVIYLSPDELQGIAQKQLYLDGNKSRYHIDKIWKVTDEKYVSSYRAEIYLSAPPQHYFSQLIKVEFK